MPLRRLLTLLTLLFLGSCATASSEAIRFQCPPLKDYSVAEQMRAADEHDALPLNDPLREMIDDYGALRNGCRAANLKGN